MKLKKFIIVLLILILFSCEKFEFSHYQISPESQYRNINQRNIERLLYTATDTIRIAIIGDSQRFYNSTKNIIKKINAIPNINFVIHTGDLVDFGLQWEYTMMHELLSELKYPYVAVVGNHDLIANGAEIYNLMYGEFNFSFSYMGNKFIFLNTNCREFGFDSKVPDILWLENELSDTSNYNHAILINHVPPYHTDFNPDLVDDYRTALSKYRKVLLCINGHNHFHTFSELYNEGIPYLGSFSTSKNKFITVEIWNEGFQFKIIE